MNDNTIEMIEPQPRWTRNKLETIFFNLRENDKFTAWNAYLNNKFIGTSEE
jgi:hypothetical protein